MKFLRLIVCIVCVFIFTKAQAQERKWRLGVRLSPTLALVSLTDGNKNPPASYYGVVKSARFGVSAGLQAVYQFTEKIGLQTGLQVSQQSYLVRLDIIPFNDIDVWQQKSNFTMLYLPIALHLRTREMEGNLRVRGSFGTSVHIPVMIKQEITLPERIRVTPNVISSQGLSNYSKIVPHLLLGAGVEWKMDNAGTLDLGMSYHLPLSYTTNKFYENLGFQSTPQSPNFAKMSYVAFDVIYYF